MAENTMRGMRLGATSLESPAGTALEARNAFSYICSQGHQTDLVFAFEAEVPAMWDCRSCSKPAYLVSESNAAEDDLSSPAVGRSHWQMLLERRSIAELEDILAEQLTKLNERRARLSH